MPEILFVGIFDGALCGGVVLGALGVVVCLWMRLKYRDELKTDSAREAVPTVRFFLVIGSIFLAIGVIAGGIAGGVGAFLPQEALLGGLVVGSGGLVLGTWLATWYERDWGHMPTPFPALWLWVMFGAPGFVVGGILGGFWAVIAAPALQLDLPVIILGELCVMALIGLMVWRSVKQPPASQDDRRLRSLTPSQIRHYRPTDLPLEQIDSLRVAMAVCKWAGFSPDSRWLLTRTAGRAFVWDVAGFDLKKEFDRQVTLHAFSLDSRHLAVYEFMGHHIQVLELETGNVTDSFHPPRGSVSSLYFLPATAELVVKLYPPHDPPVPVGQRRDWLKDEERALYVPRSAMGQEAVVPAQPEHSVVKDKPYAIGWAGRTGGIFDPNTRSLVFGTEEHVVATRLSQDTRYAVVITNKHAWVVKLPEGTIVRQIAVVKQPRGRLVGYSLPHTVWILEHANKLLIDGVTGETVQDLADLGASKLGSTAVSPEGRYVTGMDYERKTLLIRDANTGTVIAKRDKRFKSSTQLVFSPDSTMLLALRTDR